MPGMLFFIVASCEPLIKTVYSSTLFLLKDYMYSKVNGDVWHHWEIVMKGFIRKRVPYKIIIIKCFNYKIGGFYQRLPKSAGIEYQHHLYHRLPKLAGLNRQPVWICQCMIPALLISFFINFLQETTDLLPYKWTQPGLERGNVLWCGQVVYQRSIFSRRWWWTKQTYKQSHYYNTL